MLKIFLKNKKEHKKKKFNKFNAVMIPLVVIIISIFAGLIGFITDWMWFSDLGYGKVFLKQLNTELMLGIPIFIFVTMLAKIYLGSLQKGYFAEIESHEIPNIKKLNMISWGFSVIFGAIVSIISSESIWMDFLQFSKSSKFNLKDPLFNLDISFYIFKLEFLEKVNTIFLGIIVGVIILTVLYYLILLKVRTPDLFEDEIDDENSSEGEFVFKQRKKRSSKLFQNKRINNSNFEHLMNIASIKLVILGIVFYIMFGIDFLLKQFSLLHAHSGVVYGAGFKDVNITLWVYRAVMLLSLAGMITFTIHMRRKEFKKLLKVPVAILCVLVVGTVIGVVAENLVVSPDEINKETKYLENNIKFTRHAYGIDKVKSLPFAADNSLTGDGIARNQETIGNIRINDYEPVKDFYNQTQSIRQYYDFNDVDVDRYEINGNLTQTYLSPREINEEKISSTWLNSHIKYTHGYGVTLSQVDAVTSSGQPDVLVKNIPPISKVPEIKIKRPEIYFGELTNNYAVVDTKEKEFDYPDGNDNKYTEYKGSGGIKLSFPNRLLFAIREKSLKLLVSSNITSDSRILINRNVINRAKKIMPYISYEGDPYMTTVDGKLYWIIDAYTESSYYPYSEPYTDEINSTNYIRNSIKVVIDAYNGNVDYYVVDKEDPMAKTLQKIYPKLFKDYNKMPDGIKKHIRYPNSLFKIQAEVYKKYHMEDVKVFYQKEDLWAISNQIYGMKEKKMDPSYYILKLPSEKKAEFINMVPFTPKSKQNMTAVMMARNDGDNYGDLLVYRFPKNKTIYGPMQIEAQIDQNTEISKEFSLWSSAGSKYRRGDMFVIPIGNSIMYVEPVYLEASNQAIPEVKRVIVAYNDRIAYKPTLAEALKELFGDETGYEGGGKDVSNNSGGSDKESVKALVKKANAAYNNAINAQRNGDWQGYGKYINEMASYLEKLESIS